MLYNCNMKSINPCRVGLWKCNVLRTLKGYLVFINSLIKPRKKGCWNSWTQLLLLKKGFWKGCWVFINGEKRVFYTLHFHPPLKSWLNYGFFYQCSLWWLQRWCASHWSVFSSAHQIHHASEICVGWVSELQAWFRTETSGHPYHSDCSNWAIIPLRCQAATP